MMKFTKQSVERLRPPAGKADHFEWDDGVPGFGIRFRGGKRTWVAQLRVNGATRRLALGDCRKIELEPARAAAKRFFAEATLGKDPAAERAQARARAANTLGRTIDRYLDARAGAVRANTHRHLTRYLQNYFTSLHSRPADAVTRADIAPVIAAIAKEHGKASAARARSALSAFYSWALKEGIAGETNPVTFTNDPAPDERPRERTLSPAEIRAIWHTLPDSDFGKIVRLLFYTACRRSEIGNLEWSEVDFDKALLTIPGDKTKNRKTLRLPLVEEAVAILRSIPRREGSPFVFGRGFTQFTYYHRHLCLCLRASGHATDWRLHDIRRTVRSEMGDLGVDPWVGEQILNHARAGIEGTYNWAKLEKQMRAALQLWADRLREIVEGAEPTVVPMRMPA
jgi:integrase